MNLSKTVRVRTFVVVTLLAGVLLAGLLYRFPRWLTRHRDAQLGVVPKLVADDPNRSYLTEEPPERPALFDLLRNENDREILAKRLPSLYARWGNDYRNLLVRLLKAGYRIEPVDHFDPARLHERVVYLRHDIHEWDLAGAAGMMDIERTMGVGATYYLLWDYQGLERKRRPDFLALRNLAGPGHRFGLHCGLTDEYLYAVHYQEKGDVLWVTTTNEFVKTPLFRELADPSFLVSDPECQELLIYPPENRLKHAFLRDMVRFAKARTREHLEDMRHYFGDGVKTIATHGGCLSVSIADAYRADPAHDGRFLATSEHFFDQRYLRSVGVLHSADNLYKRHDDLTFVSDNPGKKELLDKELDEATGGGKAIILLIHPSLWERNIIQRSTGTGPGWRDAVHCWWDWKALRTGQANVAPQP